MPSPLFPAELFVLTGINVFVALSLLTSIFDRGFPRVLPYLFSIAALAGFGQIWVSYVFLFSFVDARFWCSMLYLGVALMNIITVNVYIAINKKLLSAAGAFLCAVTIPTIFTSFLFVSSYVNGLAISIPPLPIVPVESLYIVLVACVVILGFSVIASLEPEMLKRMFGVHRKRHTLPSLLNYATNSTDCPKNEKRNEKEVKNK